MKKTLALLLSLVLVFALCVTAFADDAAPVDSEFAVLNQGTSFFASKDATEPAGFLAQNHFVKVVAVDGDMANIVWENTCRFNGVINGDAWVSASALDMITEEDLPKYCLPYPDLDKWLGQEKDDKPTPLWVFFNMDEYWGGKEDQRSHTYETNIGGKNYTIEQISGYLWTDTPPEEPTGQTRFGTRAEGTGIFYKYTGSGTPTTDYLGNEWKAGDPPVIPPQ